MTLNLLMKKLAFKYILAAMTTWVPISSQTANGEDEMDAKARYESIAEDIADVTFDENEPVVFSGDSGRLKTAIEIASIGSYEGGFQKFVEDGTCNDPAYKPDGRGNCDGHSAFTTWQIHVFSGGYIITGDTLSGVNYMPEYAKEHPDEVIRGKDLIANRRLAIRVALRLVLASYRRHHNLCSYTGERCVMETHPKGDARHGRAVRYINVNPFIPTLDQLEEIDLLDAID